MADKRIYDIDTIASIEDIDVNTWIWMDKKAPEGDPALPSWRVRGDLFLKVLNNFATHFVKNIQTVAGKCYWYDGALYKCNVAYSGDWTPANFTATSIDELFARKDVVATLQETALQSLSQVANVTTYTTLDDLPLNSVCNINTSSILNRPVAKYGTCFTLGSYNTPTSYAQLYLTNEGRLYIRYKYSSAWTLWNEVGDYRQFFALAENKLSLSADPVGFNVDVVAGHKYVIRAIPSVWNMSSIGSSTAVFYIQSLQSQGRVMVKKSDFVNLEGYIWVPTVSETVRVRFRGDSGQVIDTLVYDMTTISNIADETIATLNAQSAMREDYVNLTLNGNSPVVYTPQGLIAGHTYTIMLNPSSWGVSEVTSTNAVYVQKNGNTTVSAITANEISMGVVKMLTFTYTDGTIRVGVRGNSGTSVKISFVDTTLITGLVKDSSVELRPSISFYESMGVIGASFESGFVYSGTTSLGANYPKSWPQILGREKGISVTNYAFGGADSRDWLTDSGHGLAALNADTAKELYIINLGSNDSASYGNDYIGSVSDIGTDADTFYGNMSKIIDAVKAKAPNGKIVLGKIRTNDTGSTANYNVAIENLATHYGVPFVTPYEDPFYHTKTYTTFAQGHPLYMGYAGMAKAWCRMIEECMANNLNYFNAVSA